MFGLGIFIAMIAVFAIFMMIYASINDTLKEADEERVQQLADKRFNDLLRSADVRVIQRLEIIDETRRYHEI